MYPEGDCKPSGRSAIVSVYLRSNLGVAAPEVHAWTAMLDDGDADIDGAIYCINDAIKRSMPNLLAWYGDVPGWVAWAL